MGVEGVIRVLALVNEDEREIVVLSVCPQTASFCFIKAVESAVLGDPLVEYGVAEVPLLEPPYALHN